MQYIINVLIMLAYICIDTKEPCLLRSLSGHLLITD